MCVILKKSGLFSICTDFWSYNCIGYLRIMAHVLLDEKKNDLLICLKEAKFPQTSEVVFDAADASLKDFVVDNGLLLPNLVAITTDSSSNMIKEYRRANFQDLLNSEPQQGSGSKVCQLHEQNPHHHHRHSNQTSEQH